MTANQGSPGTSPWPISGNVGISGTPTVGVNNFPSTQSVSGTVGIDPNHNAVGITGSLPAGTNDIGTVHVAEQQPYSAEDQQVSNNSDLADAVFPTTSAPIVLQTLSVSVNVAAGDAMTNCAAQVSPPTGPNYGAYIPMTKQGSQGSDDAYVGTLTNLDINVPGGSTIQIFCLFNSTSQDLGISADAYGQYLS